MEKVINSGKLFMLVKTVVLLSVIDLQSWWKWIDYKWLKSAVKTGTLTFGLALYDTGPSADLI